MMSVLESHFFQAFAVAQDIIILKRIVHKMGLVNITTPGLALLIFQHSFATWRFYTIFSYVASSKVIFHLTFMKNLTIHYKGDANINKCKVPSNPKRAKTDKERSLFLTDNII